MVQKPYIQLVVLRAPGTSLMNYRCERFLAELEKRFQGSESYQLISADHVTREALTKLEQESSRRIVVVQSF